MHKKSMANPMQFVGSRAKCLLLKQSAVSPKMHGTHKKYDGWNTICKQHDRQGSEQLLEMNIRDDRKIVEIWLTNAEKRNTQLKESLKPIMKQYKAKKYTVVIFESGARDLIDMTGGLLTYNRKRLVELEMKKEKTQKEEALTLCDAG